MKIWDFKFINRKKIVFVVSILLIFCFFFLNQESYAKGRFIKLDFVQEKEYYSQPIIIDKDKIFFPGSNYDKHTPTKIYDLKSKKHKTLNSVMNQKRIDYGMMAYDDDNVLILGGICYVNAKNRCGKVAEIYNISANKYELLENMPLMYKISAFGNGLIKTEKKVFIIAETGIMEFDIQTKKFKKLLEFDKPFVDSSYNAFLLDSSNILIWGGHYKNIYRAHYEEEYYADILKYDISKNKLTEVVLFDEPYWKNPISLGGVPLDNGRIMFLNGNEESGTIYIYDDFKGKIEYYGNAKFGTRGSSGAYLGNDKVLLVNGVIDSGMEPFIRPTYLEHAILDLKTNKFSKVKITKRFKWESNLIPLVNNEIFISNTDKKPVLFEY